jgi:hypothetical protein
MVAELICRKGTVTHIDESSTKNKTYRKSNGIRPQIGNSFLRVTIDDAATQFKSSMIALKRIEYFGKVGTDYFVFVRPSLGRFLEEIDKVCGNYL